MAGSSTGTCPIVVQPLNFERGGRSRIDPLRVRRAWSAAAAGFSDPDLSLEAGFFNHIAASLVERSAEIRFTPERILDLGCRSGETARLLQKRWPGAQLVSLSLAEGLPARDRAARWRFWHRATPLMVADAAALPYKRNHFDLIVSNMVLHWLPDPVAALREMRRVLAPERPLLLATAGDGTLQELRASLEALDRQRFGRTWPRVPDFFSVHALGGMMQSSGFVQSVVDRESVKARFPDPVTLLRRLRQLGIGNHHRSRHAGLTGKNYPRQLARLYRQRHGPEQGEIDATVETLFGHAWKGGGESRV